MSSSSSPFKKGVSISSASDPNSKRVSFPAAPAASSQSANSQKNYRTPHPSAFAAALSQPVPSAGAASTSSSSSQSSSSASKIFQCVLSNEKKTESLSLEIEMKEREGEGQLKNVLLQWKKAMKIGALVNTGIIAFNANGEILLIKQAGGTGGGGMWSFPIGPILAEDKESANIFNSAFIEFYKQVGPEWKPSIGKKMEIMGTAFINRSTIVWILYLGEEGGKMFSSSGDKHAKWCKIAGSSGGFHIEVDKGGVLHQEFQKAIDDYQLMQVITDAKNVVTNLNTDNAANSDKLAPVSKEERMNEFQSKCIAMIKRIK